jgi:hypothetical protein
MLEQMLVQTRVLSATQVEDAKRDADMRSKRFAASIIDLGFIEERRFAEWIARVTQLPIVDPLPDLVIDQLQYRIPPDLARDYQVLPVASDGDGLTIAMVDPLDTGCIEVLRKSTGAHIHPVVAVYSRVLEMLRRFYPEDDDEPTMLRRPRLDPGGTVGLGAGGMREGVTSLVIGSETVLAGVGRPFAREKSESGASRTESQLDRIERSLNELLDAFDALQRRIDAIDITLARVISRR